jgi:hypothetical protein
MIPPGNLADPAYEPTDEDLEGLCQRAFADVGAKNERILAKLREAIEVARAAALRAFCPPET